MKRIAFNNTTAQKIYDDYFKRVERCTAILSPQDQLEMMMELNSHVYEATHSAPPDTEVEALVNTLEKLGAPEVVLQPAVAHKKVKQATRTFNPKYIIQALYLNIRNGVAYGIFALLYLVVVAFGLLLILKIVSPAHTGLFIGGRHVFAYGFMTDRPTGVKDVLGNWFFVTDAGLMVLLYFMNTLLFRLLKGK